MAHDRFDGGPFTAERRRAPSARELALRAELMHVRHELSSLLGELDALSKVGVAPMQCAVVTAVVPKTVLLPQHSLARG